MLFAVAQVLDLQPALGEFVLPEHQRQPRPRTVGRLHRALEATIAVSQVDTDPGGAQSACDTDEFGFGRRAQRHSEDLAAGRLGARDTLGLQRQHRPVDADPEPDARQILLGAQLSHQTVVAPAAADARLRTETVVDEFERGLRVVVQAAHQTRVDLVDDTQPVQVRQDEVEVRLRVVGQIVDEQRCACGRRLDLGPLVVEDTQRVDLGAHPGGLVEIEPEQELLQRLSIARTALVVTQRGDLEPEPRQAEAAIALVGDRDDLGVQRRVVDTDRLDADLLQLAVPAGLRLLVAEERPGVADLHRQLAAVEAVLDHRAHHARGALGTQRHRAVAAVGEGVHLLAHDIGRLPDPACEQRGVLEHRQFDVAVAGTTRCVGERVPDPPEVRRVRREVVRDAPGGLKCSAHSPCRPFGRVLWCSRPARKGLLALSWPMVVWGPWPGRTSVSAGSGRSFAAIESSNC